MDSSHQYNVVCYIQHTSYYQNKIPTNHHHWVSPRRLLSYILFNILHADLPEGPSSSYNVITSNNTRVCACVHVCGRCQGFGALNRGCYVKRWARVFPADACKIHRGETSTETCCCSHVRHVCVGLNESYKMHAVRFAPAHYIWWLIHSTKCW